MADNKISKLYRKRTKYEDFVDLTNFEKLKEGIPVRGTNAKYWFKFDDDRVLFKSYNDVIEAYGEVLYSKVAEKYGINCAKYEFAKYKDEVGVISHDLAFEDDKMLIDGLTLFVRYNPDMPEAIKKNSRNIEVMLMLNKKYNNYQSFLEMFERRYPDDVKRLEGEMIKTFILDILLDNMDKNLWNIMILTDEYGNDAHFYSIDSSHIARLNEGSRYIENAINSVLTSNGNITIEDYLSGGMYGYDVDSKDKKYNPVKNLVDFYYNLEDYEREEMLEFIRNMDIKDVLDNLNVNKIVSPVINTWIGAVFNARKSSILKKLYHLEDKYKEEHQNKNLHFRKRK